MRWLGDWMDPELEELFRDDPSLQQTAQLLHAARPDAPPDPHFRNRLRAQLMQEAGQRQQVRSPRRTRGVPRPFWMRLRAPQLAWGGAALGAALIAASVFALVGQRVVDHLTPPTYNSPVSGQAFISPTEAILVSFSQPMNHASVESGLRIQPATEVTTSWNGNTLTITPVHHLTGNTPYTVTIAKPALVAASGARAAAPVQISFGTAPTPPAPPTATLPALNPAVLGAAAPGASLLFSPDGLVVSTAATAAPAGNPSPSASPAATPTPTASTSPSLPVVVSSSPTANTAPVFNTLEFRQAPLAPLLLSGQSSSAAFAPDGSALALAVPDGSGARIVMSQPDGGQARVLTRSDAAVVGLTWASPTTIEFATAGAVRSIDTSGSLQTLATPQGQSVSALAPGGSYAYLAPRDGAPGRLLKVDDGSLHVLSGAGDAVAFSGDGGTVAWIDASGSVPQLLTEPLGGAGAAAVSIPDPGSGLGAVALNRDATEVAYTETPSATNGGSPRLVVAQLPSGTPLATGPAANAAAFSPVDDSLALLVASPSGLRVESAQLPGSGSTSMSAAAATALQAFVGDQSRGDVTALRALTGPAIDAVAATPSGLSRANIVSSLNEPDGSLAATVELIVDPNGSRANPLVADESLTLASAGFGAPYLVTALTVSSLHPQSSGPHVVHVNGSRSGSGSTIAVGFDGDLDAATVPGAITVTDAAGTVLKATITYDADTRTASIVLAGSPRGSLTVRVGTGLRDVNAQALAGAFNATVRV